jgi:hypothetical protein
MQSRKSGAARVKRSAFPESNHSLCERSNGFRLGQGGFDTLMFDQRTNLIRQERRPVLSRATQLDRLFLMSHSRTKPNFLIRGLLFASGSARHGAIPAYRRVDQARLEFHAQTQTKVLQFVLDFV